MSRITLPHIALALLLGALSLLIPACSKKELPSVRSGPKLEQREGKVHFEPGATEPFTGVQRGYDKKTRMLNHECPFEKGLKHGWERRWFADNPQQMSSQILWVQGEQAFYFQWWPNGNMKQLASQHDGAAFGKDAMAHGAYVKWFEDGRIKFRAHYNEDFRWNGKVLDYDDSGTLMWDCEFKNGSYVKGYHPPDYKP
jgi:antitoxin component YwqK of YwqJK toxin-antitoxin module